MAEIHHEIKVKAAPDRIRAALSSREALQAWHGGMVSEAEGGWRFAFRDGPTFRWIVVPDGGDATVRWRCVEGPGYSPGTDAVFTLVPQADGRTLVEFCHAGWPHTGGNFRKCNTHWAVLLHHLQRHAEGSGSGPAFA